MELLAGSKTALAASLIDAALLRELLDHVRDAVILASPDGALLYANAAGRALFERDGPLELDRGEIRLRDRRRSLAELVGRRSSSDDAAGAALLLDHPGQLPMILAIDRLIDADGNRHLVLLAHDCHSRSGRLLVPLQELFHLTRAEAEIALAIARGATAAEIALDRGASINTVRGQIKSVFAKLGCSSQAAVAELVKRIPLPQRAQATGGPSP